MKRKAFYKTAVIYFITMVLDQSLVAVCYNSVLAYVIKYVTDSVALHDVSLIKRAVFIALISFAIAFTIEPILSRLNKYSIKTTMKLLRKSAFTHVENATVPSMEKMGMGEVLTRLTSDMNTIEEIFINYIPQFTFALVFGVISIVLMIRESVLLALFSVGVGVLSVVIAKLISNRMSKHSGEYRKEVSSMTKALLDLDQGFTDIKMNQSESYFLHRFQRINKVMSKEFRKREDGMTRLMVTSELFQLFNQTGLMVLGLYLSLNGKGTVGGVLAVLHLSGNASYFFQNISTFLGGIKKNLPSIQRVKEVMAMPAECDEDTRSQVRDGSMESAGRNNIRLTAQNENSITTEDSESLLQVNHLAFHYPDEEKKTILNHLSFSIRKGQFVSLEGESGCGKSTLLKILLGFYKENEGTLCLNGIDKKMLGINSWRGKISYVPQDCYLYQLSVAENVRLGKLDATREEIEHACKLACAHEFIKELPNGYDTVLTAKAGNLSGGQKQRIAIARAIVKDASLIILDEGTSALDPETELQIKAMLHKEKEHKGILCISHRKAMMEDADLRLHMVDGSFEY